MHAVFQAFTVNECIYPRPADLSLRVISCAVEVQSPYEEKRPFRAALLQAELIQSGMSADAASQRVCEELSYSEARKVKEAAKNYAAPVKAVLERRERDRRLAEYIELERAADLITNDFLEACKTINKSTPRVSLLLSSRYYERPEIQVTFPPNRQALARRLGKLDADDPTVEWDIAAICIAGEYGYSVSDVRAAFNAWAVPDRHAFTAAARDHLRRVGVAETPAAHSA